MNWLQSIKSLLKKILQFGLVLINVLQSLWSEIKKALQNLWEKVGEALQKRRGKAVSNSDSKAIELSVNSNNNRFLEIISKIMNMLVKIDNKLHMMITAKIIRLLSLNVAFLQLTIAFWALISFNYLVNDIKIAFMYSAESIISYNLGYDSVSLIFIILTTLIYILCILLNWNLKYKLKQCLLCLFIINILLVQAFLSMDLFMFYIFFESVLIPMFLLIGLFVLDHVKHKQHINSSYIRFSLFIYVNCYFESISCFRSCDRVVLQNMDLSDMRQIVLCAAFLVGLAVKIPMFPFHLCSQKHM